MVYIYTPSKIDTVYIYMYICRPTGYENVQKWHIHTGLHLIYKFNPKLNIYKILKPSLV